jgi:hypothetical protein
VSPLQTALADAFTESLTPVRKDCELEPADLAQGDLILPGGPGDNSLANSLARMLAPGIARGLFRWQGAICADPDDGLFIALPNPWNPSRPICWFIGNRAPELWWMVKRPTGHSGWVRGKGEEVVARGGRPGVNNNVEYCITAIFSLYSRS